MSYEVKFESRPTYYEDAAYATIIEDAARTGHAVTLAYQDEHDDRTIRDIKPLRVRRTGHNQWLLEAIDLDKNALRNFRFGRILVASVSKVKVPVSYVDVAIRCFKEQLTLYGIDVNQYDVEFLLSDTEKTQMVELTAEHNIYTCRFTARTYINEYREVEDDLPIYGLQMHVS